MTEDLFRSMLDHAVMSLHPPRYLKTLKACYLPVFLAMIIYRLADQVLTKKIEGAIRSPEGLTGFFWWWLALSLAASLIFPLFSSLMIIRALIPEKTENLTGYFKKYFEPSMLETMRAWGKSFLWGLLLIVPGLIKMTYYYLTLFVVVLVPEYMDGRVDALEKSAEISKKIWGKLNLAVLIFFGVFPLAISLAFDQYTLFETNAWTALLSVAVETTLLILYHWLVYRMMLPYIGQALAPLGDHDVLNV